MQREIDKKIIPIAVVIIFLGLALSPGINADGPTVMPKTVSVWMPGITEDDYRAEVEVTEEELDKVNVSLHSIVTALEQSTGYFSPSGGEINSDEWEEIGQEAYEFIDLLYQLFGEDFPYEEAMSIIASVIAGLLSPLSWLRHPIFSAGIGFVLIPFYEYETFIGKMIRPVFIWYLFGVSLTLRVMPFPPSVPYSEIGYHRVRSFLYTGLLVDFGKLGFERRLGPQLLIGYGFNRLAS